MKQLLNTLYVTTQGAYLSREGETILVRFEDETLLQAPIHTLSSVVCFGRVSASPPLMGLCAERGVSLAFPWTRFRQHPASARAVPMVRQRGKIG